MTTNNTKQSLTDHLKLDGESAELAIDRLLAILDCGAQRNIERAVTSAIADVDAVIGKEPRDRDENAKVL